MANQIDLFDGAPAKSHHAIRMNELAVRGKIVLETLRTFDKQTASAEELALMLRLTPAQASSALSELRLWGLVRKTEAKRNGKAVFILAEGERR
jgi:predicted transcriptional regulator